MTTRLRRRTVLALMLFLAGALLAREDETSSKLDQGNAAYSAKNFEEALKIYEDVVATENDPSTQAKAIFNLGLTCKALRRYEEAINAFRKIFDLSVNDREPGGDIMEPYRNYRPRAKWETGHCLFELGRYAEALAVYAETKEKHPFQSWCGNEKAEYRYQYAFRTGLCLDHLGRTAAAVKSYYQAITEGWGFCDDPAAQFRIVDIYESTDRRNVLLSLLDQWEEYFRREIAEHLKSRKDPKPIESDQLAEMSPTFAMRKILEIREAARNKAWKTLIPLLRNQGSSSGPEDGGPWQAFEAARLLAQDSESVVPLLIQCLPDRGDKWLYYALGRCGTQEAVEVLKSRAKSEENQWWARTLIYSLSQSPAGQEAIADLERTAQNHLGAAIKSYRNGEWRDNAKISYPAVSKDVILPQRFVELDDKVAFEESRSKTARIDLSTPEAAVRTFFGAVNARDRNAYDACTGRLPHWQERYEGFILREKLKMLICDISGSRLDENGRAEVDFVLRETGPEGDTGHHEAGTFVLTKSGADWIVTDPPKSRR